MARALRDYLFVAVDQHPAPAPIAFGISGGALDDPALMITGDLRVAVIPLPGFHSAKMEASVIPESIGARWPRLSLAQPHRAAADSADASIADAIFGRPKRRELPNEGKFERVKGDCAGQVAGDTLAHGALHLAALASLAISASFNSPFAPQPLTPSGTPGRNFM